MLRGRRSVLIVLLASLAVSAGCRDEEGGVTVTGLSFTGNEAVSEDQLKAILATAESSWLPWGTKRYFSREQFEADLERIEAFYAQRGYPEARVSSFDVALSDDQTSVDITIDIHEGEPVTVERIVLEGFGPLPDQHEALLAARLPLQVGAPLDAGVLQASREVALEELRDHGYPYASVKTAQERGSGPRQAIVTLRAEPGTIATFGPIEIAGNTSVSDQIVRRQLWFRPGQLYEQNRLRESQRRLYGLELFQFVNVEPVGTDEESPVVGTRVTVVEGKHRRVNFSAGYGSEERVRGEVDWRHVNFFGNARTLSVLGRYSGLDRGVRVGFNQPYFLSRFYSVSLSAQSWFADEIPYDLETTGGRVTLTRHFRRGGAPAFRGLRPTNTLAFTYLNEWTDCRISNAALEDLSFRDELIAVGCDPTGISGGDPGRSRGQISSLAVDVGRTATDNILDARRGYVASVHLEQAGRWLGGDFDFYELTTEGRYYLTIGNQAVVAVRGRAGTIDAWGPQDELVPFFKRYFLGGATTLRGWGRFEVAPLSGSGLPIGGHSFMHSSAELRFPLAGSLGGVVFLDAGNVWPNAWDFRLRDMQYAVGPGLRYNTPIGPLRVDFGYQLNPIEGLLVEGEPESRRFRVHFSIGHAF